MRSTRTYITLLWSLNIILVLLFMWPLSQLPAPIQFVGRLHPLVLHFPIVLLLVALVFEVLVQKGGRSEYEKPANIMLWFGAFSAAFSAIAGVLLSVDGGYAGDSFVFHKWFGLVTSTIAAMLVSIKQNESLKILFLPSYAVLALFLIITGHYGASLTHGEDFLTEVFDEKPLANLDTEAAIFEQVVLPILETKCTNCHNPNKLKGGLVLDSQEGLLKGGESGAVFHAGDTENSKLISQLLLPTEDKGHMPPKGKPQLSIEEIRLLTFWVESGASFTQKVNEIAPGNPVQATLASYFGPEEEIDIDFADQELIESLNTQGFSVRQIEADKPYLEVYMGNQAALTADNVKALRKIDEQIHTLDLGGSQVDKSVLKEVARFENLHRLYLDNTGVDDEMISALRKLKKLQYLNLYGTKITERGATQMAGLPQLEQLYLWQTEISPEQLSALQSKHTDMQINGGLPEDSDFTRTQLTAPKLAFVSSFFESELEINVDYSLSGTQLFYQLDDEAPQLIENGTIKLEKSVMLSVFARKEGWEDSPVTAQRFIKVADNMVRKSSLESPPKGDYQAKGAKTLFDLRKGSDNFRDGEWLGFGTDMVVNVELESVKEISAVFVSTIDDIGSWIFPPMGLEVWGGENPDQLVKLQTLSFEAPEGPEPKQMNIHELKFDATRVKHLRIRARNYGNLPEWHPGKGTPAWLFVDEVAFN